jgi:hypothetical protein
MRFDGVAFYEKEPFAHGENRGTRSGPNRNRQHLQLMMKSSAYRSCVVLFVLCILLCGCGYSFRHEAGGAKRIEVATFTNGTYKPGLEVLARDLLLQRLAERKMLVTSGPEADWILKAAITRYSSDPVAFDVRDISRQYRLTISMEAALKERQSEKTLWEETLTASAYYYTGSNVAGTEIAENHGSTRILEELSRMLVSRLLEDL